MFAGRLPAHTNRDLWRNLVGEFQYRSAMRVCSGGADELSLAVPVVKGLKAFAAA